MRFSHTSRVNLAEQQAYKARTHGFLQSDELACVTNASSTTGASNVTLGEKMIVVKGPIGAK